MKKEIMITVVLSNGLAARIPLKNASETVRKMEENIKHSQEKKSSKDIFKQE